jgi:CO/xanthine dehydrogenase Mo-binding subunit
MAPFAAALAIDTGQTVAVLCTREEEFQSPAPRENSWVRLTSAVSDDGEVLARRAEILLDAGAYQYDTAPIASVAALLACGPYRCGAVEVVSGSVLTNTVPTGSYRGPSGPQLSYAVETHVNDIAERLGLDPLELRQKLALRAGDEGPTGAMMQDPAMSDVLDQGISRLRRWRSEAAPVPEGHVRGWGLGCALWTVSPVGSAASVTVNEDGSATVSTGATEIGTGAVSEALAMIVGDELGVDPARIHVDCNKTTAGLVDHGSQGSRTLYGVGTAVAEAATEVRDLLLRAFAESREVGPDDCELTSGGLRVKGVPGSEVTLAQAVAAATQSGGPVVGSGRFQPPSVAHDAGCVTGWVGALNEPTFHCHVVELDVDTATGQTQVRRYAAIHDTGPVINPHGARGQVRGGVVQGIGYALTEELLPDAAGSVLNANFHDYRVPTFRDVPDDLEVVFETRHPGSTGYRGVKGVGEAPCIPGAAAIGSAVRDALGRQPATCSMTPEVLLRLVDEVSSSDSDSGASMGGQR